MICRASRPVSCSICGVGGERVMNQVLQAKKKVFGPMT